jgi:hypothetical protein
MRGTDELAIDGQGAQAAPHPASPGVSDADMMREELQSIINSPDFARAPIMKRLLSFLVGETAAGRGDQLKAYSVAVDGLGRAPDYDARADSYPRVQVGRLRRMLDSYYSATPPTGGLRLTIPSGRYKVALARTLPAIEEEPPLAEQRVLPEQPLVFGWQVGLLLLVLLIGAVLIQRVVPMRTSMPNAGRERPLLDLAGIEMSRRSELGNLIRASLLNGLSRSSMYDLRAVRRSGALDPHPRLAGYRLSADLIDHEHPRLFLRLSSVSPERLIWSGDVILSHGETLGRDALDRVLAPTIASISRVNGLIATHQLQENVGLEAIGYSCILLYHHYRRDRTDHELEHVRTCVKRSLDLDPNNAELQAAAAQLAIEKMASTRTDPRERPALLLTARRHSQISASIDPFNPWTNAAQARIAVVRRACPQAVSFALRATELQPYDPTLLADAGVYLLDCGDPRAEGVIRRAIALDDNPEGRFYAPLLLLAISRDDRALAQEALTHMTPPLLGRHGVFHLISAAGYAMSGDLPRARAAWSQLQASNPKIASDPQGVFERLGYAESLRAKAIDHLRRAKLIT